MAKYQLGIIYILREGFQLYAPGLANILEFKFVPEIVKDLDVVNKELFYNLLKLFISNNNIPKTSFFIVIADSASIVKDFISPPVSDQQPSQPVKIQELAEEFFEHIPFEEVSSKSITIENGIRAYGTNKELYELIKEAFIQQEFEILMVLPGIAIGPQISAKSSIDTEVIDSIFKRESLLREFNLLKRPLLPVQEEKNESEITETPKQEKKSNNKKTIMLAGVFIVLLVVLIIVYINQPPM